MNDRQTHIDPDTLAAYAVDALTSEEVVAIGNHLQTCSQCQREIASLRATGGLLPFGLEEAVPPADLRAYHRRGEVRSSDICSRSDAGHARSPHGLATPFHARADGPDLRHRLAVWTRLAVWSWNTAPAGGAGDSSLRTGEWERHIPGRKRPYVCAIDDLRPAATGAGTGLSTVATGPQCADQRRNIPR